MSGPASEPVVQMDGGCAHGIPERHNHPRCDYARTTTNSERKGGWGFMSSVLEQEVNFSEAPTRVERNSGLNREISHLISMEVRE